MTLKEISVLQAINSLGLDNSQWGIETSSLPINVMFPVVEDFESPDMFLWTWLSEDVHDELIKKLKDSNDWPDNLFESMDDGGVIAIWEIKV